MLAEVRGRRKSSSWPVKCYHPHKLHKVMHALVSTYTKIIYCMPYNLALHTYQGTEGISLAMFLVLQGASKVLAMFLPKIPPNMVNGKPTVMKCDVTSCSRCKKT